MLIIFTKKTIRIFLYSGYIGRTIFRFENFSIEIGTLEAFYL